MNYAAVFLVSFMAGFLTALHLLDGEDPPEELKFFLLVRLVISTCVGLFSGAVVTLLAYVASFL